MSSHCRCPDHERDPYIREEKITHGAPEGTVSREKLCGNCGGLIKVIA